MSSKKDPRYVTVGTGAHLNFNLDPDIYKGDVATALGVLVTKPSTGEFIPYTVKLAGRANNTAVGIVKIKMERGAGSQIETRNIELVCDRTKLDTAKAALDGKTVSIGPQNVLWTLKG